MTKFKVLAAVTSTVLILSCLSGCTLQKKPLPVEDVEETTAISETQSADTTAVEETTAATEAAIVNEGDKNINLADRSSPEAIVRNLMYAGLEYNKTGDTTSIEKATKGLYVVDDTKYDISVINKYDPNDMDYVISCFDDTMIRWLNKEDYQFNTSVGALLSSEAEITPPDYEINDFQYLWDTNDISNERVGRNDGPSLCYLTTRYYQFLNEGIKQKEDYDVKSIDNPDLSFITISVTLKEENINPEYLGEKKDLSEDSYAAYMPVMVFYIGSTYEKYDTCFMALYLCSKAEAPYYDRTGGVNVNWHGAPNMVKSENGFAIVDIWDNKIADVSSTIVPGTVPEWGKFDGYIYGGNPHYYRYYKNGATGSYFK